MNSDDVKATSRDTTSHTGPSGTIEQNVEVAQREAQGDASELAESAIAASVSSNRDDRRVVNRIWDDAYDNVKTKDPKLVGDYERLMSLRLQSNAEPENGFVVGSLPNHVAQADSTKRRAQMEMLLASGTEKTRRERDGKEKVGNLMKSVNMLKSIIDSAVSKSPEASLAWSICTLIIPLIENVSTEMKSSFEGVEYICNRIDWYSAFLNLALDEDENESEHAASVRKALQKLVT